VPDARVRSSRWNRWVVVACMAALRFLQGGFRRFSTVHRRGNAAEARAEHALHG